jgi:hypothetical protein
MGSLERFPDEKESYCHIKDKINLYQDYNILKVKCYACEKIGHVATECSDMFYVADSYTIARKVTHLDKVFRAEFKRHNRPKFKALKHLV